MAKVNTFSWDFMILLITIWIQGFKTEEEVRRISFDYDQCNGKTYNDVTKTKYEVNPLSQSTVLYRTTNCALTFKTENGDICMDVKNIMINDCNVKLNIFTDNTSEPKEVFSCNTSPTDFICSQKKVMKIQLLRRDLDVLNYDFTLIVMRKDTSQLNETDVVSDGLMKTIIITIFVIIVIIITIVIAVCCCSKCSKQNRNINGNILHTQQTNHAHVIPTAPPANEVYPGLYDDQLIRQGMLPKENPPPYSEHS